MAFPDCVARTTTEPGPVTVIIAPLRVAGPETNANETGSPDVADAERVVGEPPNETEEGGLKERV